MKYVYKKISGNVNVSKHHPLKYLFSRILVLIVAVCVVYFVLSGALEVAIRYVPDKIESILTTSFFSADKFLENSDPESQQHLEAILSELLVYYPGTTKQFKIYVIEQDEVNAIALPGNTMIIFSGLLEKLNGDKELAFVVGHELGHYLNHDHLRGLGQGAIFMAVITSLGGGDPGGIISKSINLFGLRYSRKQESAADLFSLSLLKKSYGNGQGAISALEKLGVYGKRSGIEILDTHPSIKRRILALKKHSFNQ